VNDGEESGSYIRQWRGRIRIIYKTVTGKNQDYIYDSDEEESGSSIRQWRGRIRIIYIRQWQGRIRISCLLLVTVVCIFLILPRHCLIYDPDSSPSLSYIWSWFFPVTVLYMILILPRHSLSYIWSWFFPVTVIYMILILPRHCLISDPDSSSSLSYI
jgi:hypothetical protein